MNHHVKFEENSFNDFLWKLESVGITVGVRDGGGGGPALTQYPPGYSGRKLVITKAY